MGHALYLLGLTALGDAPALSAPPRAGDVVCFLRRAQDPAGEDSARLRAGGITVVGADEMIDQDTAAAIDALGDRFLREWFIEDGEDFSRLGELSLGTAFAMEIARQTNPRVQVRLGETLRRLLEAHPGTKQVFTDLRDGAGVFEVVPAYLPLRRVLDHVASAAGVPFRPLAPVRPIPPALYRRPHNRWLPILRSLAGGLRVNWLLRRRRFRRNARARPRRPVLYMFLGRAQERIARRLAARGRFHVVCDRGGVEGADAVRSDQLLALPALGDLRAARALLRRLDALSHQGGGTITTFAGIDYGRHLYGAVRAVLRSQIRTFLVVVAQSRRLQEVVGFDALFVNGGGAEPMGNLIALNRATGRRLYLMPHGLNLHRTAYFTAATDHPHVTYLCCGGDHTDCYRSLPEAHTALRRVALGNPLTVPTKAVRRPARHGRRLLILAFGHLEFWNAGRVYACDQYYIELFDVARDLAAEGWRIGVRAHPYHPRELEKRIAAALGLAERIAWDGHATFEDALAAHDVVVGNLSSACYEALYAGWPTIFYEPDWRRAGGGGLDGEPMLIGLPVAADIERPAANDPQELGRLIRETLDPESPTATFPRRFATEYAARFIGERAADSDLAAAEFIERDFFATDADDRLPRTRAGAGSTFNPARVT